LAFCYYCLKGIVIRVPQYLLARNDDNDALFKLALYFLFNLQFNPRLLIGIFTRPIFSEKDIKYSAASLPDIPISLISNIIPVTPGQYQFSSEN